MKQTDRVPHKARGAAENTGAPAQSAGVPAQSAGVPAQSAGVPAQSAGVPAESAGTTKTSYPLMKYLSLLLAVALLFSGVTFARYLSNDQIDASVGIAAFDATYSIDRVNTTTFGNQSYWIQTGETWLDQGAGTAITVGITLKNNGDTSVMPTLHFEGPAEYWNNIALQLTTALGVPAGEVLTPQLVIKDIVGAQGGSFNTQWSKDYGSLGGDATLELSDSVVDDGNNVRNVRTATWTYGEGENAKTNKMTITKRKDTIDYSVGFARKDSATGEIFPPIFVDCQKETEIYSIDLELPALNVAAKTENGAAKQDVVVWLTWTNALANTSVSADRAFWGYDDPSSVEESGLTGNMKGDKQFTFNNQYVDGNTIKTGDEITVLGYHYDVPGVPVVDESGEAVVDENGVATGETTTVRVKKTFASEDGTTEDGTTEDGTTEGKTEYFHVASLNDTDGNYVHDFKPVSDGSNIHQCQNKQNTGNRICIDITKVTKLQDFDTVTLVSMVDPSNPEGYIKKNYAPIQQRAFGVSFRATFVQSSEVPNS